MCPSFKNILKNLFTKKQTIDVLPVQQPQTIINPNLSSKQYCINKGLLTTTLRLSILATTALSYYEDAYFSISVAAILLNSISVLLETALNASINASARAELEQARADFMAARSQYDKNETVHRCPSHNSRWHTPVITSTKAFVLINSPAVVFNIGSNVINYLAKIGSITNTSYKTSAVIVNLVSLSIQLYQQYLTEEYLTEEIRSYRAGEKYILDYLRPSPIAERQKNEAVEVEKNEKFNNISSMSFGIS